MLRFAHPWLLSLLLLIPLYLYWELRFTRKRRVRLYHSRLDILAPMLIGGMPWKWLYPGLRALILLCLIIAIVQPQWGTRTRDYSQKGVDIALAIDISGSMLAMDFAPQNRLGAAVEVAKDFVQRRPNDRFALVAFSEYSLTRIPLTYDHAALQSSLDNLQVNEQASGTAIGMGLAKAVARLKDSKAKSRLIILITDGVSNTGEIDPITAAEFARELGIKVYPIGVGSGGMVPFPFTDPIFGKQYTNTLIELDMDTLDKIASLTGTGKAALATDSRSLKNIMTQIDKLEQSKYKIRYTYNYSDHFLPFLWLAFILLCAELLLKLWLMPILPDS